MNIKDRLNNIVVSENPLHSLKSESINLSSLMNNHNEGTLDNLIFNDHLYDNQIK